MLSERWPIICLVTDRRRLSPGGDDAAAVRCLIDQLREAVDAGIDLVQIRERGLEDARLADLVAEAVGLARGSTTLIVVNDRLDVALASGAHGVHLRADSMPPRAARSVTPFGFLVGRSVHAKDEAIGMCAGVDYLVAGTVFPTASKPGADRLLGEAGLAEIVRSVAVPVLAIGGITRENVSRVAAAGAAGIAGIGLFSSGPDHTSTAPCRGGALAAAVQAARASFGPAALRHGLPKHAV